MLVTSGIILNVLGWEGRDEKRRERREGRRRDGMKMSIPFIPKLPLHHCQYT